MGHPTLRSLTRSLHDALQRRVLLYDKSGEEHYNLISALHKSVRNSDPDAALYWLGRMLEAGEDPLYVARRVVRMAVEDIGLADPNALVAVHGGARCGRFHRHAGGQSGAGAGGRLSVGRAQVERPVQRLWRRCSRMSSRRRPKPVPLHLRNAPTSLMKGLGYGAATSTRTNSKSKVADMECLPDNLRGRVYYQPTNEGIEKRIRERLEEIKRHRSRLA